MINLVPADSSHPLYHDGPVYTELRHHFLLDCMVAQKVDPNDQNMLGSGLKVLTMHGRELLFKKQSDGKNILIIFISYS